MMDINKSPLFLLIFITFMVLIQCTKKQENAAFLDEDNMNAESLFTIESGWSDIHEISIPEPGILELTINDLKTQADITCYNRSTGSEGARRSHQRNLFLVTFSGYGALDDGTLFEISGQRQVTKTSESGRIQIDLHTTESMSQISIANQENTPLPVLHIDSSGAFTFSGNLQRLHHVIHSSALTGAASIAGKCQEGWLENQ